MANCSANVTCYVDLTPDFGLMLRSVTLGMVLFTLCLFTAIGNAGVLYAVKTERRLQTVSNMFIVSLAVSDLIVGAIVMPISATYILTEDWYMGEYVCKTWLAIDYTASTASIFNIFILSLDRYWSVTTPLKYLRKRTKKRASIMICTAWGLSMFWIFPIFGWHYVVNDGKKHIPDNVCDTEFASNAVLKGTSAIINYYLPLTVMYVMYGQIYSTIRQRYKLEVGRANVPKYLTQRLNKRGKIESSVSDVNEASHLTNSSCGGANHETYSVKFTSRNGTVHYFSGPTRSGSKNGYGTTRTRSSPLVNEHKPLRRLVNGNRSSPEMFTEKESDCSTYSSIPEKSTIHVHVDNYAPVLESVSSCSSSVSGKQGITAAKRQRRGSSPFVHQNVSITRSASWSGPFHQVRGSSQHHHQRNASNKIDSPKTSTSSGETIHKDASPKPILKSASNKVKHSAFIQRELKAARQLGVIMGAFTVCFLPYFILFLVVAVCQNCIEPGVLIAMTWVGYLNSMFNPLLYALCNDNFKWKFKKMLNMNNTTIVRSNSLQSRITGRRSVSGKDREKIHTWHYKVKSVELTHLKPCL
ncbi:5-hydroxytryptamine receptor 1B [Lingula anatina]|uniref:5-hydroxytryptamine receptor 1B n=1 Tax=Lingula anatina TaxID=7574 RepID=A0A1S3K6K8_LINAN|nr:5-hydroxytryptamine receptor 1B [Lingula anatina]|eukprot:XP_013418270.1 5-hydroxytryptamine receptor 1B [Lingula anatina]